jgi:hypothetical protein
VFLKANFNFFCFQVYFKHLNPTKMRKYLFITGQFGNDKQVLWVSEIMVQSVFQNSFSLKIRKNNFF